MPNSAQLAARMLEICNDAPQPVFEPHVQDAAVEAVGVLEAEQSASLAAALGRPADVGVATGMTIYAYKHAIRLALADIERGDTESALANLRAMLERD